MFSTSHPSSRGSPSVIRDNMTVNIPDNLCPQNVFILGLLIYGNVDCRRREKKNICIYIYICICTCVCVCGWWVNSSSTQRLAVYCEGFSYLFKRVTLKCDQFHFLKLPSRFSTERETLYSAGLCALLPWRELPQFLLHQTKKKKKRGWDAFQSLRLGSWKAVSSNAGLNASAKPESIMGRLVSTDRKRAREHKDTILCSCIIWKMLFQAKHSWTYTAYYTFIIQSEQQCASAGCSMICCVLKPIRYIIHTDFPPCPNCYLYVFFFLYLISLYHDEILKSICIIFFPVLYHGPDRTASEK